ncbi:hypothetical protein BJX76DRAFT_284879 [Aspergillus varians]
MECRYCCNRQVCSTHHVYCYHLRELNSPSTRPSFLHLIIFPIGLIGLIGRGQSSSLCPFLSLWISPISYAIERTDPKVSKEANSNEICRQEAREGCISRITKSFDQGRNNSRTR